MTRGATPSSSNRLACDHPYSFFGFKTGILPRMATDDFAEVQRQLEATPSELMTANDPERRRKLLREMSRLVAEAERISGSTTQKISQKGPMSPPVSNLFLPSKEARIAAPEGAHIGLRSQFDTGTAKKSSDLSATTGL